ncbi:hypothetical protein LZ186_21110, partial [Rhodovulum sulfidophilum]|nr:hypothetical protein [Rhodovulum sulfidophilum]
FVAGDGAGIVGPRAAELQGRISALRVAEILGRIDRSTRDALAAPLRRQLRRELAVRPFLDAAYPPFAEADGQDRDETGLGSPLPSFGTALPGGVPGILAETGESGGETVADAAGWLPVGGADDAPPAAPEAEKAATGSACHAGEA